MIELETIEALVSLMITATIVGIVAARMKVPYTVSLVLVGLGINALHVVPNLKLTPGLLLTVFLPALLFEAAIHFPAHELKQYSPTIATLALPGILISAIITAWVLSVGFSTLGFSQSVGFLYFLLFGTIIAATDPVSVISLLRQLGVDRKLSLLIEGESVFNDGTAIVFYHAVLIALNVGHFDWSDSLFQLISYSLGGIFIGSILGLFAGFIIPIAEDHLISIAITTVTAYGSYLLAERVHTSGILATVMAGLFVGNLGSHKTFNANTRVAVTSFWEYVSFFITSIVFLLMGLEVSVPLLFNNAGVIAVAYIAVLASRAVSVYMALPILKRMGQPLAVKEATIIWWSGLRGALSMVLVLSLPETIAFKDTLIAMTFGVVVLSVVFQGSTIPLLLRWLKLMPVRTEAVSFLNTRLARLKAIKSQLETVSRLSSQDLPAAKALIARLQAERVEILKDLEERQEEASFQEAAGLRLEAIKKGLKQIAKMSYRDSLESNLLTEKEAEELTLRLE
ncbi:MAG: cation:proton antiporter [Myxococcaceae bacterium]|nr:cation:proton antiporter [Myxococcaceae bacterium]MBH2006902.1 cation:proton antiporter [Myxococcaceae bacterium]